jgi:hypothetical protein
MVNCSEKLITCSGMIDHACGRQVINHCVGLIQFLWHWYKLIDGLCKYISNYRQYYHATYANIITFSRSLIKNYAMRRYVGVEVYLHAFSTTLNRSEFALCAGGYTQENGPPSLTGQDVGWDHSVANLCSCGCEQRIWKSETGK